MASMSLDNGYAGNPGLCAQKAAGSTSVPSSVRTPEMILSDERASFPVVRCRSSGFGEYKAVG